MLRFAERDTPEWHAAWHGLYETLKAHGLSADDVGGEAWQYMGTVGFRSGQANEFRHRCEATTGRRVYVRVPIGEYIGNSAGSRYAAEVNIMPEPQVVHIAPAPSVQPAPPAPRQRRARWVPEVEDYGGAFDGNCVVSDADPGL